MELLERLNKRQGHENKGFLRMTSFRHSDFSRIFKTCVNEVCLEDVM